MSALDIALPLFVALFVSALSTPLVARLARSLGVVDKPNERKVSLRSDMPLMGGVSVAAGVAAGLGFAIALDRNELIPLVQIRGFLIGGFIILLLGVWDDRYGMRAWTKLGWQIVAALVAYTHFFTIHSFRIPTGSSFELYWWVSLIITVFWIVAVTNAINLIDGLDGLATGVATIMAITLCYICLQAEQLTGVVIGVAVIGGALGFLPFNFPPARIFLGDTGALYLGFCISLLAIEGYTGGYRRASVLAFVVPFLALAVPLMDTLLSIIRRIRDGRGIFDADRMHMHHRLLTTEGSHSRAVIFLYLLTACFCAIAVSFTRLEDLAIGAVLLVAVVILTFRLVRNLGALSESSEGSTPGPGASAESGDGGKP